MKKASFAFVLFALATCAVPGYGQVTPGTPPFGSFGGGPDIINLGSLNSHITVPVLQKTGRGMNLNYNLTYDTSIWTPATSGATKVWQQATNWGWTSSTAAVSGHLSSREVTGEGCPRIVNPHLPPVYEETIYFYYWTFYDYLGTPHPFPGYSESWTSSPCGSAGFAGLTSTTTDGSGYSISVTQSSATVTTRKGTIVGPPVNQFAGPGTLTDRNGNMISVDSSGNITDTLGTVALIVAGSGTPSSPITFTYSPPAGGNATYTMKYTAYTVQTNFGCSGVSEFGPISENLVSEIDLPDGTKYTLTYEPTPGYSSNVTGRLASVTLPTGGTISYKYTGTNNGIECSDGSAAGLQRTTPDTGSNYWNYARSGSGSAWTTTVTDPQNDKTAIQFQEASNNFYETERQIYQGSATLLKTILTCYNGASAPCNSTAITLPISQKNAYAQWPGSGAQESETAMFYNGYGLVTEKDEYAYGAGSSGSIVRKTLTAYASLGNGIVGLPSSVTVETGSGVTKAQTAYSYDQTAVTTTSGTPQLAPVSGSRGNVTTVNMLVSSSAYLTKTFTYYDTGNVNVATDTNGAPTTYSYGSSCGNSLVTSVSEPIGLSRSMTWNCTGGVETSMTDENNKTTSLAYTDSYFWRPSSSTDQISNTTSLTYTPAGQSSDASVEGSLHFNGSGSTSDGLVSVDGLGRAHLAQVKEAPSSGTYDSVETDYDLLGRPDRTTLPYAGSAGQTNSSAPGTTTIYDPLGRESQATNSGGMSLAIIYTQNDTYQTLSPAPSGENTKRKQFEYDALGRLTSVCEITSLTGSGTCGQTSSQTGFWTQYSYDVLNNLTGVTQNAQTSSQKQTRSYAYDGLGRMTSETNPESGTTSYVYDSDATCGTSSGDLVKKIDAAGNVNCFTHDQLHRVTSTYIASGPYSTVTPYKYFTYDSATVDSAQMANTKGRLAEAYTSASSCPSPCSSKITDEGFSYTPRGEASDIYESTGHSGGYYHVNQAYWANGVPNTLSGVPGLPTITYTPDGEGRVYSASASTGQNPLGSTSYNVASQATQVNFGSSDSDAFTFDPNTGRMTKYTFAVNVQSVVGQLTWNSIGTLETLAITDPFNGPDNQTCNYTHDDLTRVATVNCGSPWSQSFTYDALGNLSKSGSSSFQPTYSYLTNQMTEIGSSTPTYDANGNVTNDFLHTYAWDAAGRPVTIDGVGVTYDALGRMIEQNRSGAYTEIVYTPSGAKLALMSAQSLTKAFVPLTGGSMAVYTSSGLAYYRHSDWIGTSRFASTPSRTMYYDGAYAPFGESYAEAGTTDRSFTGMNQDTVAALYDFPAREYGIQGRWPSPDPAGISSVNPSDPQTWNRYAYVRNSPLHTTDSTGMHLDDCDESDNGDDCGEGGAGDGSGPPGPDGGECGDMCDNGGDPGSNCSDPSCQGFQTPGTPTSCDPSDPSCGGAPPPYQGCDPGDFSCDPFSTSSNECLDNAYSGNCTSATQGFQALNAGPDPCVYLNDAGNGIESTDFNSSPGECKQTGGQWILPGSFVTGVDPNGNVISAAGLTPDQCNQMNRGLFWLNVGAQVEGAVTGGFWGWVTTGIIMTSVNYYINNKLCGGPGFFSNQ